MGLSFLVAKIVKSHPLSLFNSVLIMFFSSFWAIWESFAAIKGEEWNMCVGLFVVIIVLRKNCFALAIVVVS